MDWNMSDSNRPFQDNEEVIRKYQILLDHLYKCKCLYPVT